MYNVLAYFYADYFDAYTPEHGKKPRGQPLKEKSNPAEGYDSAIAWHLAANEAISRRDEVGDFSVLTRERTKNRLNMLEAVCFEPCVMETKLFVTSLPLFMFTPRTHPS